MDTPKQLVVVLCCAAAWPGCTPDRPPAPRRPASRQAARTKPAPAPAASQPATRPQTRPESRPATRPAGSRPAETRALDELIDRILAMEKRGEFSQAWKLAMDGRSAFAGHPRAERLRRLLGRLRTEKRQAATLGQAVLLLDSETVEAVQIAASTLANAGPIGTVLLRKAVRTGPENVAARAADILARLGDAQAGEVFWQRLDAGAGDALRPVLLRGLAQLGEHIPPAAVAGLVRSVRGQPIAKDPEAHTVLATAYARLAGGDAKAFDRLAGSAGEAEALRRKVRQAVASTDPAEAKAAAAIVPLLGLVQKGLRGHYYAGTEFQKLLFHRIDQSIAIENGKSPCPDGRSENLSIRWTGLVVAPRAGKYTFYPASDDGIRLWVAGKKLVDNWTDRALAENPASIDLTAGTHEIKVEYYQGTGEFGAYLKWRGPGIDKQLLTGKNLLTPPSAPKAPGATEAKP